MPTEDPSPSGHWDEVEAVQRYERELREQEDQQTLKPQRGQDNANLIYILYLVNMAVPFLGIVGVIMAYSARDHAEPDLQSHYDNQIRIFWITVIGYIISVVLMLVFIGVLLALLVFIWKIVRVATAMSLLSRGLPVRNVESFSFTSD
ncbi:DUF4870 family protein [Algimonas porphyrae]|uniref:DUF4870 domain-containing protein n=1 Tax=Algimonas porphyrae TaxID=1128113 RepID=A0ABQ5V2V8_9PROT|nr:DUF4870 domain-containing protein [Algimonas porphyrae]GLQ21005.1 hypothetical protein GCM10007854_19600 [Algimonas porphyrae]